MIPRRTPSVKPQALRTPYLTCSHSPVSRLLSSPSLYRLLRLVHPVLAPSILAPLVLVHLVLASRPRHRVLVPIVLAPQVLEGSLNPELSARPLTAASSPLPRLICHAAPHPRPRPPFHRSSQRRSIDSRPPTLPPSPRSRGIARCRGKHQALAPTPAPLPQATTQTRRLTPYSRLPPYLPTPHHAGTMTPTT